MNHLRIIAPSDSWKSKRVASYNRAEKRLVDAGYNITYGKNVKSLQHLGTASAESRAIDFNDAFAETDVDAIIVLHGGFAANEILPLIDWEVVKSNPKPFIGYSDITVLLNAIYAKTGSTSFLGPNFGTLGYEHLWEYSFEGVIQVLKNKQPYRVLPSREQIDNGVKSKPKSWHAVQQGTGQGVLIGGNIQSFFLLQGTEYQPDLKQDFILAVEDDSLTGEHTLHGFSRNLDSILQLPGARQNVQGIIIGRFESDSKVNDVELISVIKSKGVDVPIICNVDFGHTMPIATLPIGAVVKVHADNEKTSIEVLSY